MIRIKLTLLLVTVFLSGCGPSAHELREQTISILNKEAEKWDGGKDFKTTSSDAYGRPLISSVNKTTLNYALELRSSGPDGLPKNSDDIVVNRSKPHGETTITKEIEKAAESVGRGAASGMVKGIKKGFGQGNTENDKK